MSLEVRDLTVYYQTLRGDVRALENATFTIESGEIMGLAGESGCGKTTLGHSLIYLAPPMKHIGGRVTLNDVDLPIADIEAMNPHRFRDVSIIPQYAMNAMNPVRKIGRMTEELLRSKGVDYAQIRPELQRRLDLVRLRPDVMDLYPIELSGGMKQRMVMVLSTLLNPFLLIADEITSALDVASQKAVAQMLVEFREQDCCKSAMVITHDISILYQIADSIMIMYAGQIAEKAATDTIIHEPRHPYTKLLISTLPEIGAQYTRKRLQGIAGKPPLLLLPPAGCRFRERCPVADAKCVQTPPLLEVEAGHSVACWREVERRAQA